MRPAILGAPMDSFLDRLLADEGATVRQSAKRTAPPAAPPSRGATEAARAPEGLTSYAKAPRIRPLHLLITVLEGLFGLMGVVVLILLIRYGSFEKAGAAADGAISAVTGLVQGTAHI